MLISESQLKIIINEEIEKMMLEGDIEEGWFSDARKGLGKYLAGKAAKLGGLTSTDVLDKAADMETAEKDTEFMAKTKADTAKKSEIQKLHNQVMSSLGVVDQNLDRLEEFSNNTQDIAAVRKAGEMYAKALEQFTEKLLGYKLRESRIPRTVKSSRR